MTANDIDRGIMETRMEERDINTITQALEESISLVMRIDLDSAIATLDRIDPELDDLDKREERQKILDQKIESEKQIKARSEKIDKLTRGIIDVTELIKLVEEIKEIPDEQARENQLRNLFLKIKENKGKIKHGVHEDTVEGYSDNSIKLTNFPYLVPLDAEKIAEALTISHPLKEKTLTIKYFVTIYNDYNRELNFLQGLNGVGIHYQNLHFMIKSISIAEGTVVLNDPSTQNDLLPIRIDERELRRDLFSIVNRVEGITVDDLSSFIEQNKDNPEIISKQIIGLRIINTQVYITQYEAGFIQLTNFPPSVFINPTIKEQVIGAVNLASNPNPKVSILLSQLDTTLAKKKYTLKYLIQDDEVPANELRDLYLFWEQPLKLESLKHGQILVAIIQRIKKLGLAVK